MAKTKQRISGPGRVLDRSAKKGKIKIAFDPSPGEFIGEARRAKERLIVNIQSGDSDDPPIEISASGKLWAMQLEDASIPADRLAELEAMITEEEDVHVTIEYAPVQEKLPGMDGTDAKGQ